MTINTYQFLFMFLTKLSIKTPTYNNLSTLHSKVNESYVNWLNILKLMSTEDWNLQCSCSNPKKIYSVSSHCVTMLIYSNNKKHASQMQLNLMNGSLHCYMFWFVRNHHEAIHTKYLKHISSSCFFHYTLVRSH